MKMKIITLLCSTALAVSMTATAFAGTWKQDSTGWWYQNDDGSYPVSAWLNDNNIWYHFNAVGYMQTGWIQDGSKMYYLEPSGAMRTADLASGSLIYHFDNSGACTNPTGDHYEIRGIGGLSEAENNYLLKIKTITSNLTSASETAQNILGDVTSTEYAKMKQSLLNMRDSLAEFAQVEAPLRFADAQENYGNACNSMIDYIDICNALIDHIVAGTNPGEQQIENWTNKAKSDMDNVNAFVEAGHAALESAIK